MASCFCCHDKPIRLLPIWAGGQMPRRDEEFHQVVTVLEHVCDVNGVTKVPSAAHLAYTCTACDQQCLYGLGSGS